MKKPNILLTKPFNWLRGRQSDSQTARQKYQNMENCLAQLLSAEYDNAKVMMTKTVNEKEK